MFIFALGLVSFVVRIWWPASWIFQPLNAPVGYLPQYMSLYILGLIAYRRKWFFELSPRMGRDWSLIALMATLIFGGLVFPSMMQAAGAAGTQQAGYPLAGGFHWLAFGYALLDAEHVLPHRDKVDTIAEELGDDPERCPQVGSIMDPPDQARVTCIDGVESQHVAIMPTLACPHEGAVGVDRHDLEVVSLPDWHDVADLHAMQLWDDVELSFAMVKCSVKTSEP